MRDFEADRDSHIHKMPESRGPGVSLWEEEGRRVGDNRTDSGGPNKGVTSPG